MLDQILTQQERDIIRRNSFDHTLFSWSKQAGLDPLCIERAEGVYLYDYDGRRYLDFSSQLMNVNIGHGHTKVRDAVFRQMSEVSFVHPGMVTRARGDLGKKLAEISPGMQKAFFCLGGSEANENAIKIARIVTGRHKIVTQYQSYHGASYATLSSSGDPRRFAMDSQAAPGFVRVENPYYYRCPWKSSTPEECAENCAANLERILMFENPYSIAAILLEGESGSSGCIKYPPGYWQKIKAIADRYGILLIADEVMSGFGRTGKMFAIEHHGVIPDMITMAKGITSGYIPMGALMVSEKIASFFDERVLSAGLTCSAHPVACAAAMATIQVYEEENMVENAAEMGHYVDLRMQELMARHASIGDFRNTGLFGCIELVTNRDTREPLVPWNATPADMAPMNAINARLRELGMFTYTRWNWIFIAPPLCITRAQIDEGLEIISRALETADRYVRE